MEKEKIEIEGSSILITGAAGFIGTSLVMRIINDFLNVKVIGIDSMNDYYDISLKEYRIGQIEELLKRKRNIEWNFIKGDISDDRLVNEVFQRYQPDMVINLAAQAGVRYSIARPKSYIKSNIVGFFNIMEACRHSYDNGKNGVKHFVYASSSSVYGGNTKIPYSTDDRTDSPVSLYAATKKCNELLAHSYAQLYGIPSTGLRFFTVYGPAGRPDMAYFKFTNKLKRNEKIELYNYGKCKRDFTYIDDVIECVVRVMQGAPKVPKDAHEVVFSPHAVYNIGAGKPINIMEFVKKLSEQLINMGILSMDYNLDAHIRLVPMQPGDVSVTYADMVEFENDYGYLSMTSLGEGLKNFVMWYKDYYEEL